MDKRKIIIDCDPGVDDILALGVLRNQDVEVLAISTVTGNTSVDHAYMNTRVFTRLARWNVPVIRGSERPIGVEKEFAQSIHGEDGLAGLQDKYMMQVPMTREAPLPLIALKQLIEEQETPIDIIATGPLTNIASILSAYPELKEKINAIHIMGGGFGLGNVTPLAEFNFNFDPLAAQIVLASGIQIFLSPLNTTQEISFTPKEIDEITAEHPATDLILETLPLYMEQDPFLHDVVSVLTATQSDLFEFTKVEIDLITTEGDSCGMIYEKTGSGNFVDVAKAKDRDAMVQAVIASLNSFVKE